LLITFAGITQFPEDNGPMAHPIRPESYIAMDNFYTSTVYNKGAEVGSRKLFHIYDPPLAAEQLEVHHGKPGQGPAKGPKDCECDVC
jgi:hypothetical protein